VNNSKRRISFRMLELAAELIWFLEIIGDNQGARRGIWRRFSIPARLTRPAATGKRARRCYSPAAELPITNYIFGIPFFGGHVL